MRRRHSSTSSNKLSPPTLEACSDGPLPPRLVQNPRGTRRTSSTCRGELTHSNTLSRPSSGITSRDDPDGPSSRIGSMTGSFPQSPTLGTRVGSPYIGPAWITRETSFQASYKGSAPVLKPT
jgi:hypothetical protein